MANLKVPPPARIAIGSATVGGQKVELFLNPEWARYFESLNSQVVVTAGAVGLPGAPGATGAAGAAVGFGDDGGGSVEFIPGPKGDAGAQGSAGLPVFLLQETAETPEPIRPATQLDETFIAPTLLNSWVNYDATTYNSAGYYKDAAGVVHLRGFLKSGTVNTTVFTLPAGYRPSKAEQFATNSNDAIGRVYVDTSGNVVLNVGSNVFFTLDGITFRAAGTF